MKLEEAIKHCYKVLERDDLCYECKQEHLQLAKWLEKLQQLEDLEEELGIDLITLFNLKKIYYKYFEESDEIYESFEVHFDITNKILRVYQYPEDEFGISLEISRYGHLWSLDRKELEDE